jgi:hypothetical protein
MKRRTFIKSTVGAGAAAFLPSLTMQSLLNPAHAVPAYNELNFTAPAVLPQVINVFLYGGASELAGNLTNIVEIDANSQNPYPTTLVDRANAVPVSPGVTPNGFWQAAGGNAMEFMVTGDDGNGNTTAPYMSIYRTIMKRKNTSRSHRDNIFMGQKGSLDFETTPGMGTRLATMMYLNRSAIQATTVTAEGVQIPSVETMLFPFISFEGETTLFAADANNPLPLRMRGLTLDEAFNNPYTRLEDGNGAMLDAIVDKMTATYANSRFQKAINGFTLRQDLETRIGNLQNASQQALPTNGVNGVVFEAADLTNDVNNNTLVYPNTGFGDRMRAAVTLAIENPTSVFIAVGTDGLGGWDDHNNGFDRYPGRMQDLHNTLRAAAKHIKYSGTQTGVTQSPGGVVRTTDNIVINVYGDFGRLVNRNNSNGWDHANNMNLYTVGGAAVAGMNGNRTLGKIVGTTERQGNSGQNNQFTAPTSGSYEAEPLSISSTVYRYFGAQNPEVLTKDDVDNPNGDVPLDESVASECINLPGVPCV